jgi:hypothetical protein
LTAPVCFMIHIAGEISQGDALDTPPFIIFEVVAPS